MLDIKHDKSYLRSNPEYLKKGFQFDAIQTLCFEFAGTDKEKAWAVRTDILDWMESTYKLYQYKKDNGIKYKEHDLFYWANNEPYFTIDINHDLVKNSDDVIQSILNYAESKISDMNGYIRLQYATIIDWDKINAYIMETDEDQLPFNEAAYFKKQGQYVGGSLGIAQRKKLYEMEKNLFEQFVDKKVIWEAFNGEIFKGTLKQAGDGTFRLFKPRATRTFYHVDMTNTNKISVA